MKRKMKKMMMTKNMMKKGKNLVKLKLNLLLLIKRKRKWRDKLLKNFKRLVKMIRITSKVTVDLKAVLVILIAKVKVIVIHKPLPQIQALINLIIRKRRKTVI